MVNVKNVVSMHLCCHLVVILGITPQGRPAGKAVYSRLPVNVESNLLLMVFLIPLLNFLRWSLVSERGILYS